MEKTLLHTVLKNVLIVKHNVAFAGLLILFFSLTGVAQTSTKSTKKTKKTTTTVPATGTETVRETSTATVTTSTPKAETTAPVSTPEVQPSTSAPAYTPPVMTLSEKSGGSSSSEQEEVVKEARVSKYDNPEHSAEDYMGLKEGWFIGADVGTSIFYGDVALYNNFPKFKDFKKSAGYGFSVYGGKKFKYGLSAEIQLFKGTLKGEKRTDYLYPRYFKADLMSYSISAKYNLSQLVFRQKNDRPFFNRLTAYINVGVGQAFFSSRLYKYANNDRWYLEKVNGFSASGIDSAGASSAGGLVTDKTKMVKSIILPYGGKLNFKLNPKTDIALDVTYVTVFSDQVDSWVRSWTHRDRYLYLGIGLVHNFGNQTSDEIPQNDRLLRPHDKKIGSKGGANGDAYDKSIKTSGSSRRSRRNTTSNAKDDKDLEIRLKLYEIQLKLFEMQYLTK